MIPSTAKEIKSFSKIPILKQPNATYTVCASGCDFSSIQTAIDTVNPGDSLNLAGETFTESITIDKSLDIIGVGAENTIYACGGRDSTASSLTSVEMLSFQGFTLAASPDPLVAGQNAAFTVTNGDANTYTFLGYSMVGPGSTYVPWLFVTLDLASPKKGAGPTLTNSQGGLVWNINVPLSGAGRSIWLQAVQYGKASNVVATSIQ